MPIRERIVDLLATQHMQVVGGGASPGECIAAILDGHPDVVVLDMHLQGGSGLEVLRAVRRSQPGIAFVVFSNHVLPPLAQRYLSEGASSVLDKTLDFLHLAEAIEAAPGTRRLH